MTLRLILLPAIACVSVLFANASIQALAADNQLRLIPGPVLASIIRIIDGDTLLVDAHPWPGQAVRVSVRLRGIDTPERRSRCPDQRAAAALASAELARLVAGYALVELSNVGGGKYYGRVLADLKAGQRDVASAMLESGLAQPYQGGKRQQQNCDG